MKPVEQLKDDEFAQQVQRAMHLLPDAPAAWQQAAIDLWLAAPLPATRSSVAQAASAATALLRFVAAALTFDSWAAAGPVHGVRSARNPTRHLLYSAQGRDIDLRITPSAEQFVLSGQILGPDESGRIELAATDAPATASHSGALDELGEFRLEGVPAGRYILTLHLGAQPIVVQPIDVGGPA